MFLLEFLDYFYFLNITFFFLIFYLIFSICLTAQLTSNFDYASPNLLNTLNSFSSFFLIAVLISSCFDISYSNSFYFFNQHVQFFFLLVSIIALSLNREFLKSKNIIKLEYDLFFIFFVLSALFLCFSDDLIMIYLAIELQSLIFYVLATFNRNSEFSTEAGLKYFIFGATASCFLVLGFSFVFLIFGVTSIESIFFLSFIGNTPIHFLGILFIFFALIFKIGIAPFHLWVSDVYDGSMLNVTLIFSSLPKMIIFSIILKLFVFALFDLIWLWVPFFHIFGMISVGVGSFSALFQKKIKRLFAYSSVAHSGFILLGFLGNSTESTKSIIFYVSIYSILTILLFSFLFLINLSTTKNLKYISNWTNLGINNWLFATSFILIFFSIAGIPPLAGFFSKFFVLFSLIANSYLVSSFILVILSSIACFYYIRLIKIIYFSKSAQNSFWISSYSNSNSEIIIAFLTFFNFFFFFDPEFLTTTSGVLSLCFS